MQQLAQAHGPDAQGSLLLLMATLCLLPVPGVGSVLGLGIAALAWALWRGEHAPGLPPRVARLTLPRVWARRVLGLLARTYGLAGRHARARMSSLAEGRSRPWIAATTALMALIVLMPIPFGNLLPALALMLIGLALVFRDGLALLLGLGLAGVALLATVGLLAGAWYLGAEMWPIL